MKTSTSRSLTACFDRWLFDSCHPVVCSILRIACASLLLVYWLVLYPELEYWFTDAGVMTSATAQHSGRSVYGSLLFWLPSDASTVRLLWWVMFVQTGLLWLGCLSRFQIACIFVGLVSFQHRNNFIFDGQDTMLRMLAFCMIFMPLDYRWSLGRWLSQLAHQTLVKPRGQRPARLRTEVLPSEVLPSEVHSSAGQHSAGQQSADGHSADRHSAARGPLGTRRFESAWGLRLVQLQVSAVYLSTAWEKAQGNLWRDGTALYYVSRMDDLYGRFTLPDHWFETAWLLAAMTWGVVLLEGSLPVLLWCKPTRKWALLAAIGLHLSIELTMHVFLFQWVMIVSLLSFLPAAAPLFGRPSPPMAESPR